MEDIWELAVAVFLVLVAAVLMLVTLVFPSTLVGCLSLVAGLIFFAWGLLRGVRANVNHNDGDKE